MERLDTNGETMDALENWGLYLVGKLSFLALQKHG
jgi:hypothetical protein